MDKIILLVLVISAAMVIGPQAAFATTVVWPFYGESPAAGVVSPSVDAANNPDDGCINNPHPPSCKIGVANNNAVIDVPSGTIYNNVPDPSVPLGITGDQITAHCFIKSQDPTDGDFTGFDFESGDIETHICRQNQRGADTAAEDIGLGVKGEGVFVSNPDELQNTELIVLDLNDLLVGGYTDAMFILSSHQVNHLGWVATSNKGPTETVLPGDLTLVGIYPGSAQGTGAHDVYINFDLQRYMYFRDVTVSDESGLDFLVQQIKAEMPMIGGSGIHIDQASLAISGMKTTGSYMIPILMAAAGFGILIARRF